ncbi:hypothetical protein LA303_07985 [Candidatus Sulfidibacterium hydrothermale]|uniref:hypothetical protein n=1 Tax=Candidatus Sulfidibacterium hydrothermale TaxID=2875962 RepID=UPI001F0AE315|nr:hypothetical protein [Candidatus Sulfidibacterium hydrothermale]UBM61363.1 hypothetical protein LA303_07985 [Candidatus Sulfidibacterium hydrothermale]
MKYGEIEINQDKIEFHNSLLGIEKIIYNGKEVSKKISCLGTTHKFKIGHDNFKVISRCQLFCWNKIKLTIVRNNEKIYEGNIPISTTHKMIWFAIGLFIGMLLLRINF